MARDRRTPAVGSATREAQLASITPGAGRVLAAAPPGPRPLAPARSAADALAALDRMLGPVEALLERFLAERVAELSKLDAGLEPIGEEIAQFVNGSGKRLRPAFVYWGYRATGAQHLDGVTAAAAAVELLHTFALIHDDVMDRSPERRGRPSVHSALTSVHEREGLVGDAGWFGVGGAILAGDLAFVWADQLLDCADLPSAALERARRVFTELRVEVMAGQYLDLRLAGLESASEADARRVALLKSGRYTVTRPLQLGAAIAGDDPRLDAILCAYGDAVGLAFQLRDDVLGVFGNPSDTGKGALEDLREGKRTVLMLRTLASCTPRHRAVLDDILGDPTLDDDDAEQAREIIVDCGALDSVEQLIRASHAQARRSVSSLGTPARSALEALADLAAFRVL